MGYLLPITIVIKVCRWSCIVLVWWQGKIGQVDVEIVVGPLCQIVPTLLEVPYTTDDVLSRPAADVDDGLATTTLRQDAASEHVADEEPHVETHVEPHVKPHMEPLAETHVEPHVEPHADTHVKPHVKPHMEPLAEPHVETHVEPHGADTLSSEAAQDANDGDSLTADSAESSADPVASAADTLCAVDATSESQTGGDVIGGDVLDS